MKRKFYYDKKGYPRWRDNDELVHRSIAKPKGNQVVHHKDGNPHNFRKENLEVMSRKKHSKIHFWRRARGLD